MIAMELTFATFLSMFAAKSTQTDDYARAQCPYALFLSLPQHTSKQEETNQIVRALLAPSLLSAHNTGVTSLKTANKEANEKTTFFYGTKTTGHSGITSTGT